MTARRNQPAIPELVIRQATESAADVEALVDLEIDIAVHHASIDPERWRVPARDAVAAFRRRRRLANPGGVALVATIDAEIVGALEIAVDAPIDPGSAHFPRATADFGITVAPEWRSRGVGAALMRAAEDWARANAAERMVLDMSALNTGALRFYERLGYEVHGLLMDRAIAAAPKDLAAAPTARPSSTAVPGVDQVGDAIPTLDGDVVRLRALRPTDRDALIDVLSDPTVTQWWDSRGPQVSTDELLADDPDVVVFGVEVDGRFAGSIQYHEELEPDYRHAGIDIFLHSSFQGRGVGTDAVRTLARYLIDVRGHHRLTIDPAAANARAIHTYEKVGFKPVGVMRRYERGQDGTFHDGLLMDMLAGELR